MTITKTKQRKKKRRKEARKAEQSTGIQTGTVSISVPKSRSGNTATLTSCSYSIIGGKR